MLLPIARSLGRHGIDVDLGWVPEDSPVRRSRHVRRFHGLPPLSRTEEWIQRVAELHAARGYDLVLPATEPVACAMHGHRGRLHALPYHLPSRRSFEIARDKQLTAELAGELQVPVPRTDCARDRVAYEKAVRGCRDGVVVKPLTSIGEATPDSKQFVRRFRSADEALRFAPPLPCLVQEVFGGDGVGIGFLAKKGQILRAMQHVRLHETTGHGSTYRMTERLDADLVEAARRLAAELDYTGVGMFEFRRCPASRDWVLIEANPRFWGSLPLSLAAGVDFPWNLYELLVLDRTEFPQEYRVGVRCRNLLEDVRFTRVAVGGRSAESSPSGWQLNDVSKGGVALDWLRMLAGRDAIDTFAWDDTGPARAEMLEVLRSFGRTLLGRRRDEPSPAVDVLPKETTLA